MEALRAERDESVVINQAARGRASASLLEAQGGREPALMGTSLGCTHKLRKLTHTIADKHPPQASSSQHFISDLSSSQISQTLLVV